MSAPRCPIHPGAAAVASCVGCGRWVCDACRRVDDDGLCQCPACLSGTEPFTPGQDAGEAPAAARAPASDAPAPREPAAREALPARPSPPTPSDAPPIMTLGPTPIPWERPEGRDVMAFLLTAREAMLGPTRYMGRVPWVRGDLRTPLLFAVLAGVIGQLCALGQVAFFSPPTPVAGLGALPPGLALASAPLLPLVVLVALFLKAGSAHAMLRLAGAPPRPFEATFRVFAYAEVASLLLIVPWVGPLAARFYVIFLLLTGLRFAQVAGFSASLLALAPSLLLMWVLV